ncbi:hypothetical protein J5N97_002389 [Dioscorea zingiberensis]|uniref:Uncharacterized protein n=1 Tax=Dioscorea zingiberensis TaxID=325984 RepID=A0A9D5HPE7_9LILI|nr:hypothetical protein J5N97_002389 [Dioscorea zingiberensis]
MEGLIPYVYKVIVQYRNGGEGPLGGLRFSDSPTSSPSMAYIRLPGDSGKYRATDIQLFPSSSLATSSTTLSSPRRRSTSRKLA